MASSPWSTLPHASLAEFLVAAPAEMVTGGIITREDFDKRRGRAVAKRADGSERKEYKDLDTEEKLTYLYSSGQQTQRDLLQNSIRLYGVKKNDARGITPTDILKWVCEEGLKLSDSEVDIITNSGLRTIQRVESGKCIVFQLNRVDMIRKIFENIGNLRDFVNPYNKQAKIVLTRNLCPEDNKIRSECLSVKELLKERGFRDIKIRFNKLISVNGGPWHEYSWFLEHRYGEANLREQLAAQRQGDSSQPTTSGRQQQTYANVAQKRKGTQDQETEEGGDGDVSSNASPTGSEAQQTDSAAKPKKQRKPKKPKH